MDWTKKVIPFLQNRIKLELKHFSSPNDSIPVHSELYTVLQLYHLSGDVVWVVSMAGGSFGHLQRIIYPRYVLVQVRAFCDLLYEQR